MVLHGDNVAIGRDISLGLKNLVYTKIHEHILRHLGKGVKKGKSISWGANLVFLDLPFGGVHVGGGHAPTSLGHTHIGPC